MQLSTSPRVRANNSEEELIQMLLAHSLYHTPFQSFFWWGGEGTLLTLIFKCDKKRITKFATV